MRGDDHLSFCAGVGIVRVGLGSVYISVFLVMAGNGSALTAGYLEKRQVTKRFYPLTYGASPRLGIPSLRYSSGGIASGLLRCTSTRPPDGADQDQKLAGELTLGLLSGEERSRCTPPPVGAGLPAMDDGTPRGVRLPALSLTTIASRLAPTVGLGYIWKTLVGCQAAIAGKPAPTGMRPPADL
jgi:hypothetical protein